MNPTKTGISRLLIATAIDPDVYHRLLKSPEETFAEFNIADEDRELLRHPDHRLLRVLGTALAEESAPVTAAADVATMSGRQEDKERGRQGDMSAAASVAAMSAPPAVPAAPLAEAPRPGTPTASAPLPDMSLVLTLVPCALYEGEELRRFAYAAWVSPLPEGADPRALPPPPGTVLPGKPLPPLHAVVRVSAIQMQDAAGNPLVGLSAALLQSTNISTPPPPEAAGNPAGSNRDFSAAEVQAAIAAVHDAPAGTRYDRLIELLRVLHPEGTS